MATISTAAAAGITGSSRTIAAVDATTRAGAAAGVMRTGTRSFGTFTVTTGARGIAEASVLRALSFGIAGIAIGAGGLGFASSGAGFGTGRRISVGTGGGVKSGAFQRIKFGTRISARKSIRGASGCTMVCRRLSGAGGFETICCTGWIANFTGTFDGADLRVRFAVAFGLGGEISGSRSALV